MNEYVLQKQFSFPKGHIFYSEDGEAYTVTGFLGKGGQGEAYRVSGDAGEYAVKFYNRKMATHPKAGDFWKNLKRNADNGVPQLSTGDKAAQFIWPLKMIRPENGSFGYLMKLFPEGYEPMGNIILQSRLDPGSGQRVPVRWKSWFVRVTAALNIARAFEILHVSGLSYQDINEGGFAIDPETGDVLICDCDNVAPDGSNMGIIGAMGYMAPEVIMGKTLPNRYTDEYSLAVILFRLFFQGHPMEGRESRSLHNEDSLSRREADRRIYGSEPHYCLAETNNQNPADAVYNYDVYAHRFTYPMVLMRAFERVFTKGITDLSERLTATEWRKVLLEVRDSLVLVQGKEQFYGLRIEKKLPEECRTLRYPHGRRVLCMPGKILYRCHLEEAGTDFKTAVGKIIPSNRAGIIGLYNATGAAIRFAAGDRTGECADRGRIPLVPGMVLYLGREKITVE